MFQISNSITSNLGYINSETAKQIAARYNVPESDALEVLNQYPLMKGEGVAYTPEEIAAKETADFKITPDLIEKIRIKTDERNRQERQTVEAEQERQRTETQTAAREAELRQRAIEEIKQENIDNRRIAYDENGMMHDPETGKLLTPTPTEEEIGERVRSIKAAMLDDDSAATARGDAATLNETLGTKSAAIIGGLMGGTAGVNRSIAGLFRSIGFEGGYDAFSKIAQKSQILNDYTGDDGTTTQLLKIGGSLPFDVARIAGMSKLPGGMIVGFAADHKFQAEGAGKNSWEVQKDTAKGGAMGGVFSVAAPIAGKVADTFGKSAISFIDAFPSNAAYKAANIGKAIIKESTEIAVIGHGSYQVSKAFGATDEQARSEMLGNVLFHVANKAGAKAFDKIYKIWNKGEANDVYLDPQGKAKLLKGEVEPNYVDAEIVSDPKSLAYKASENAKRIGGTVENENVGNRGNRIEGNQEAQRSLAAENPRRIDVAQPEAVQKVAVDTRAQKVIENIKDGNTYTAEQVQKATRINAKNLDETLLNLYAAKAIEINPDNSFRFIGGENAATGNKSLFERAGEVEAPKENITLPKSSVENEIVQQIPANGENLVRKDVSSPNEKVPDLSIYEALPQQKTQETQIEKPKARLDYAEPENIAEKLNVFTERGRKASIAPKVVEQSDLLTSLDEGYPPEFQPRDRSRAASKAQISEI